MYYFREQDNQWISKGVIDCTPVSWIELAFVHTAPAEPSLNSLSFLGNSLYPQEYPITQRKSGAQITELECVWDKSKIIESTF